MPSRILIVEDNPIESREISLLLQDADFSVELCVNAELGFERLSAEAFDMLLADLHLPGEDGFSFCRKVKADARFAQLPVVLLTRYADPLNVLRGLEAGADGFISKGQEPAEIVSRLCRVLDRRTKRAKEAHSPIERVVFLQTEFNLDASRDQLLEVLLSGFEDAASLNERYEKQVLETIKAQRSMYELKILYQSLVESLPLGIMRKNCAGRYTFANDEYCAYYGRTPADVIGGADDDLLPNTIAVQRRQDEEHVVKHLKRLDRIETYVDDDGRERSLHVRHSPLRNAKSELMGTQATVWDITDLKRAQEELAALNRSLEDRVVQRTEELAKRNAELEQRNSELDQYAYIASHDLQEPLRKLISFSQLLESDIDGTLNETAKQDLFYITSSAHRMQRLVQDLLAYSRVGRLAMNLREVSLDECVQRALEALALRIEEMQPTIVRDSLPTVQGDAMLLTQLYQNLIGNALKFIRGRNPELHLTVEEQGNQWVLGVRDNGIGIDARYSRQIFAPFQRLHSRTEYDGTGVGLAICQAAVERHRGKIWVESEVGIGSHFKFTLLKQPVAPRTVAAPGTDSAGAPAGELALCSQ